MNKNTFNFRFKIHNLFTNKYRFVHNLTGRARPARPSSTFAECRTFFCKQFVYKLFTNKKSLNYE